MTVISQNHNLGTCVHNHSHPLIFDKTMQSNTFCVGNGSKSLTGKKEEKL